MIEQNAKAIIKILFKLSKNYGPYFVFWLVIIFCIYNFLFEYVELESVIFSLIAISLLLSILTKKVFPLKFLRK